MADITDRVHAGETYTVSRTIVNSAGTAVDISAVTSGNLQMFIQEPDGTTITRTGSTSPAVSLTGDGTDGVMEYTFAITELDKIGRWRVVGFVTLADASTEYSEPGDFVVSPIFT